jgi:folate-binding protein YgfZ
MLPGYHALRENSAWLDLSTRGKIKVGGEDRARLLHAMTTNHVEGLAPGQGCYAYFLSAQGRILADVNIFCGPEYFLLDTEPEMREKVTEHLDKFIIADDVTLEDVTRACVTIALEGPRSAEVLEELEAPIPKQDYENMEWGPRLVARAGYTGGPGFFLFAPAEEKAALIADLESAGASAGTAEAFRVVRLEHGRPRYGEDITDRYLAQETNQIRALNFSKGCYLGQEIVERVRSRGQVHRLLLPLELDTAEPPQSGAKLVAGDGHTGAEIASAAFSPSLGKVVALAYVRLPYAQPGTKLALGDIQARVSKSA